ncbi:hypothetical protein [Amycolatopsis rifamycinica]|uniref:hypothetical protein n=1 Tax=Amycolatopsis rifamycinica TaxID=287986 RepID=UPI00190F5DB3|nr:hypothetical protein [Amycolatopsis rifamycinica]
MRPPTGQPFHHFRGRRGREDGDVPERLFEVSGRRGAEHADRVRVLLFGGAQDLLDAVDRAGVDDLHAVVAQNAAERDGGRIGSLELDEQHPEALTAHGVSRDRPP